MKLPLAGHVDEIFTEGPLRGQPKAIIYYEIPSGIFPCPDCKSPATYCWDRDLRGSSWECRRCGLLFHFIVP